MATPRTPALRLTAPPDPDPLENWHQEEIFRNADLFAPQLPELKLLYAVPNGGFRYKATAAAMQRQGVKSGVPDMALDVPRRGYHGLKIELKRFKEGDISKTQEAWLTAQARNGYRAVVCWGWEAAWQEILWYLGREDLLSCVKCVPTQIIEAYPQSPFWQRKRETKKTRFS